MKGVSPLAKNCQKGPSLLAKRSVPVGTLSYFLIFWILLILIILKEVWRFMTFVYPFLVSFFMVFLSELGDKTQLLVLSFLQSLGLKTYFWVLLLVLFLVMVWLFCLVANLLLLKMFPFSFMLRFWLVCLFFCLAFGDLFLKKKKKVLLVLNFLYCRNFLI